MDGDQTMTCPNGGEHNYQWVEGRYLCLKCERVASFQPVPFDAHKKYSYLLGKCRELVNGQISLNEFKIFLENERL